jgi:hypothetical protein
MSEAAVASNRERLTWEQIRARYPDAWVDLDEVEWEDGPERRVRTAIVLRHTDNPVAWRSPEYSVEEVGGGDHQARA